MFKFKRVKLKTTKKARLNNPKALVRALLQFNKYNKINLSYKIIFQS